VGSGDGVKEFGMRKELKSGEDIFSLKNIKFPYLQAFIFIVLWNIEHRR
jgi:hypothetical protein